MRLVAWCGLNLQWNDVVAIWVHFSRRLTKTRGWINVEMRLVSRCAGVGNLMSVGMLDEIPGVILIEGQGHQIRGKLCMSIVHSRCLLEYIWYLWVCVFGEECPLEYIIHDCQCWTLSLQAMLFNVPPQHILISVSAAVPSEIK